MYASMRWTLFTHWFESDGNPEMNTPVGEVTALLSQWKEGHEDAHAKLTTLVYPELRKLAEARMRAERKGHTLQPTALVNEVFVELLAQKRIAWQSKSHFMAVASRMMRRILVDYARAQRADKRGGDAARVTLDPAVGAQDHFFDILQLNDLLETLGRQDERAAKVVELRYFGGLSHDEIAETLEVSKRTVVRDWEFARAWLYEQLNGADAGGRGVESN